MSFGDRILLRMFGRPTGVLGRIGGLILARFNRAFAEEIVALLEVRAAERVLEVGFGPGVAIELLAGAASVAKVAGIDPSTEMVEQASARNAVAIRTGAVDLRQGSVESMPFEDDSFGRVLATRSGQALYWWNRERDGRVRCTGSCAGSPQRCCASAGSACGADIECCSGDCRPSGTCN